MEISAMMDYFSNGWIKDSEIGHENLHSQYFNKNAWFAAYFANKTKAWTKKPGARVPRLTKCETWKYFQKFHFVKKKCGTT